MTVVLTTAWLIRDTITTIIWDTARNGRYVSELYARLEGLELGTDHGYFPDKNRWAGVGVIWRLNMRENLIHTVRKEADDQSNKNELFQPSLGYLQKIQSVIKVFRMTKAVNIRKRILGLNYGNRFIHDSEAMGCGQSNMLIWTQYRRICCKDSKRWWKKTTENTTYEWHAELGALPVLKEDQLTGWGTLKMVNDSAGHSRGPLFVLDTSQAGERILHVIWNRIRGMNPLTLQ